MSDHVLGHDLIQGGRPVTVIVHWAVTKQLCFGFALPVCQIIELSSVNILVLPILLLSVYPLPLITDFWLVP